MNLALPDRLVAMWRVVNRSILIASTMATAMLAAAVIAVAITPRTLKVVTAPHFESTVPLQFAGWTRRQDNIVQIGVSESAETTFDKPYNEILMRTYVSSRGEEVMLALAWGQLQRQDIKVHRPDGCYKAQGYEVLRWERGVPVSVAGRSEPVPAVRMLAAGRGNLEVVTFWIRIGSTYGGDGIATRWYMLKEGLDGRIPDGILVRASQRIRSLDDLAKSQAILEKFLTDLTIAIPQPTLALLVR